MVRGGPVAPTRRVASVGVDATAALELRYRPWLVVLWGLLAAVQVLLIFLGGAAAGSLWVRVASAAIAAGAAVVLAMGRLTVDRQGIELRGVMGRRSVRWPDVDKVVVNPASRLSTVKVLPRGHAAISAGAAIWRPTTPGRLDAADLAAAFHDRAVAAGATVEGSVEQPG